MKQSLLLLILLTTLSPIKEAYAQLSKEASISILTCRAGDDIYNTFGHNAIRVVDPTQRLNEVYNYGMFSFDEEGFTMKFLRGKLLYWIGRSSMNNFLRGYVYEKRSVLQQELSLSQSEKNKLYTALRDNYRPENRSYLYDFFFDNCATRIRDILADNVENLEFPTEAESGFTFRSLLDQFTYRSPWTDLGMDLLVGRISDKEASIEDQMYLPEFLYLHLENSTINGQPLVAESSIILDHEAQENSRDSIPFFTPVLFFGLLLLLEIVFLIRASKSKWLAAYDNLWFLLLGIGGIVLAFMWWGTDHIATKDNLNLLWMSPLFILLTFKKGRKIEIALLMMLALSIVLSLFVQSLHSAVILIIAILIVKLIRHLRYRNNLASAA